MDPTTTYSSFDNDNGRVKDDFTFELHMAVRAGDSDRLYRLNEGLARIRANGTYDRLHEKWIGPLETRRLRPSDLMPYLPAATVVCTIRSQVNPLGHFGAPGSQRTRALGMFGSRVPRSP